MEQMKALTAKPTVNLNTITDNQEGIDCLVSTVSENRKGYTQRQFVDDKAARRLYHVMGCPGAENFKNLLRQNIIINCPVTVDHVNIAKKIFGPNIGSLKGKTTRKKPTPVRHDYVEIPPELIEQHKYLVFCMDIFFICGLPILSGIDRSVKNRSSIPIKNEENEQIYNAIDKVFRKYQQGGFYITDIHCDQQFRSLMDPIADELNLKMNYTTTNERVPEAERNNRTIKEQIRAVYHSLPYKAMSPVMLMHYAKS
jgi:hypothetical protein